MNDRERRPARSVELEAVRGSFGVVGFEIPFVEDGERVAEGGGGMGREDLGEAGEGKEGCGGET